MRVVDRGLVFDAMTAPANSRSSAFTGVTLLENGDLLVSFRTGTGRDTPDGRLRIMRSRDTGNTWETLHSGLTATIDGIDGNLIEGFFTELPSRHPERRPQPESRDLSLERASLPRATPNRHADVGSISPVGRRFPPDRRNENGERSFVPQDDDGARGDETPLLGSFAWVDRSNPDHSFVNPETAGILPMRVLLAESGDGGATWGPFRDVDVRSQVGCAVTGPVFSLADGALALPYESWKEYDDPRPGRHVASLRLSFDGGESWPEMSVVAADPSARIFFWDQRIAQHPETEQLVAMFWTHDRETETDIENHIAWGSSDGREWTVPAPAGWRGQHCQPLVLGGDRLAALYVHRHDPPSLRAVISDDFGRTWRRDEELVFYESRAGSEPGSGGPRQFEDFWQDMMAWRFGHPRGVLLPDGDIFVAFYAGDDTATSMHWVRIDL